MAIFIPKNTEVEAVIRRVNAEKEFLAGMMATALKAAKKRFERIGECGSWLTTIPNKLNGNVAG